MARHIEIFDSKWLHTREQEAVDSFVVRHELALDLLEDELELSLAIDLGIDACPHILRRLVKLAQPRLNRLEAVVLGDILASHHSLTLRALDSNHLTGLLMLQNVATGTLDFAVGSGVTRNTVHFITVACVVFQDLALAEFLVTQLALHHKVSSLHKLIFLRGHELVLSSALNGPKLLDLRLGESVLIERSTLILFDVLGIECL